MKTCLLDSGGPSPVPRAGYAKGPHGRHQGPPIATAATTLGFSARCPPTSLTRPRGRAGLTPDRKRAPYLAFRRPQLSHSHPETSVKFQKPEPGAGHCQLGKQR